ncbi:MAG: uracil-DNA glycosylase [Bacteroidales bacterium]|jgi:uracil-DNA glycosylase|nr:uracil-DNA glycosylase [Bacteroidales bacterium]HOO67586.1 uracil-DNA glycosylase [Bacteroidales bacterium]HPE21906.1 uracil-DNA glycosylase [Bacteroidales bacterium]HPJ06158.1 uracil-DNA glycosylase [Bacteroidales bacterium]HPQ63165.1 uracil-DNA glycosylase [Bacteroidales bacterium]
MDVKIEAGWKEKLREEFEKEYFLNLTRFVREEYRTRQVFPPGNRIFNAFDLCPFDRVRVVIIGQDPYHNIGQAHGLCFSVTDGTEFPPSLVNIFKELNRDLGIPVPNSGNLERWARQGVLLLNAILTVRAHQALSHQNRGWERFTDAAINALNHHRENLVFMLWGAYAQNKGASIDQSKHLVLKTVHPSPLSASRGFFGCSHFSRCNEWLTARGLEPVAW